MELFYKKSVLHSEKQKESGNFCYKPAADVKLSFAGQEAASL